MIWIKYVVYHIFFHFFSWPLFQNLRPPPLQFSSQPNSTSNYPTQKINKNNKTLHNDDCILAKKLLYHKKTMLFEKLKLNFLQLQ